MIKRLFLIWLLVLVLFTALFPVAVFAIADPDTPPTVNGVYVYDLTNGGVGVLVDYYLDYAVPPTETATEAFMAIFIDTDGATQLKSVAPFAYDDGGYGHGCIWIEFTAAEVLALGIDRTDVALYNIWLIGNPMLAWAGDPPKTIAGIGYWQPVDTVTSTLLALRILDLADDIQRDWLIDLITVIPSGNKLSTYGVEYFTNVIPNLRDYAPNVFAAGEYAPVDVNTDYNTEFGATMTNLTGTVALSPITLVEGANTVNVTAAGTFTLELEHGTVGTVVGVVTGVSGETGTVTGDPVDLVYGTNTITVPVAGEGTLTVTVELENTQTKIDDTITGTAFDLTGLATIFGTSRLFISGIVWLIISLATCAYMPSRISKARMLVFDIMITGGAVLAFMEVMIAGLLFLAFGIFIGYIVFYRGANI